MTMKFRAVTKQMIKLLGDSAAGRFSVIGYKRQAKATGPAAMRSVQVFFGQGDFPKSGGRAYGATAHEMTFGIIFTVSEPAKCNLAAINAPGAPPEQIAAALAGMRESSYEADNAMDELFEQVYQILMDARNADLGLMMGTISDRWITQLKKDDPQPQGTLLTLTGVATYTCRACEEVTGDVGVPASEGIAIGLDLVEGDSVVKAGLLARGTIVGVIYDDGTAIRLDDGTPMQWG